MHNLDFKLKPGNLYCEIDDYTNKIKSYLIYLEKDNTNHGPYVFYDINEKQIYTFGPYYVHFSICEI